mmetsp:Transcript_6823/g.16115  ORF Transcript_6823/g.16115 Transcript_6823/m.16115 type:complete len:80 (+) Transcript_6823:1081-1320(+)
MNIRIQGTCQVDAQRIFKGTRSLNTLRFQMLQLLERLLRHLSRLASLFASKECACKVHLVLKMAELIGLRLDLWKLCRR